MPPDQQTLPDDFEELIKRWPLVVINSDTPQEALAFLSKQLPHLPNHLPPDLTRFAHELHAASRYVMGHGALLGSETEVELLRSVFMKLWNNTSPGLPTVFCNR